MKLSLVLLIVGINSISVTRQESDSERITVITKRCSIKNINIRTRVMESYADLNELCGVTTSTTTTTTLPPCSVTPALVTLFALYDSSKNDHFYVTTSAEVTDAKAMGYIDETSPGQVTSATTCPCGTPLSPVYRAFNSDSNDHFYTAFVEEADNAVVNYGFMKEGVKFYCSLNKGVCGATLALFRLRDGSDHIYSTDPVPQGGAVLEGVFCYIWPS